MNDNFSAFEVEQLQLLSASRMKDVGPTISILSILTSLSVYTPVKSGVNPANPCYSSWQNEDDLSYYNFFSSLPLRENRNFTHLKEFEDLEDKYRSNNEMQHQESNKRFLGRSKHVSSSEEDLDENSDDYKDELDGLVDGRVWHSENLYRRRNVNPNRYVQRFQWLDYNHSKALRKRVPSHSNKKRVSEKEGFDKKEVLREFPNRISKETSLGGQEIVGELVKELDKNNDEKGGKQVTINDKPVETKLKETSGDLKKEANKIDDQMSIRAKDELTSKMDDQRNIHDKISDKDVKSDKMGVQSDSHSKISDKDVKSDKMGVQSDNHDKISDKDVKSDKMDVQSDNHDKISDKDVKSDKMDVQSDNHERISDENKKARQKTMGDSKETQDKDEKQFEKMIGDGLRMGLNKDGGQKLINSEEKNSDKDEKKFEKMIGDGLRMGLNKDGGQKLINSEEKNSDKDEKKFEKMIGDGLRMGLNKDGGQKLINSEEKNSDKDEKKFEKMIGDGLRMGLSKDGGQKLMNSDEKNNDKDEKKFEKMIGDGLRMGLNKDNSEEKNHDKDYKKFEKINVEGLRMGVNKDGEGKSIKSEEKKNKGGGGEGGKDKKNGVKGENQKCGSCSNAGVKADIVTGKVYPTIMNEPYSLETNFWSRALEQRFQGCFESAPTLKVIVVPFSHNDAAWLRTFDEYYYEKSRKILDNLTREMIKYKDMTFVWSEICFLSRWWKSASRQSREDFLDLVRTNRVEICPGGWVMADEACPHLFALLVQLTEGHLWVKDNLGILPRVGWSIDPFGHSSTMAYMMQEAGLTHGNVIQRVHFGWKSYFAKQKAGDFMWKQPWDKQNRHGVLTHHQPFNIYSASVSCGPHPEVCRQFDFNLSSAAPITFSNVKMKTELLFSEYWRTGSLFPHNVVMVSLGDDFRYASAREFAAQYKNYKAIMDYGNSDKKLRTEISFGTPSDYFRLATRRLCKFPVLEGDFYPYADYDEHGPAYWTGYYSTRPHHKKLTRVAEWNLRSAEILFTLALNLARQNKIEHDTLRRLYLNLINARRQISLFQHHDGITGTSRAYVMEDFRNRLIEANTNAILVQSGAIQYIFGSEERDNINYSPTNLTPLTIIIKEQDLSSSMYTRLVPGHPLKIVVFNPLGSHRQDVLRIIISNPCVEIKDIVSGKFATYQVNPVWYVHDNALYQPSHFTRVFVRKTEFELVMLLDVEPLSLKIYEISEFGPDKCCFLKTFIEAAKAELEEGKSPDDGGVRIPDNFRRPHNFASVYSLTKARVDTNGIFTSKTIQVDWLMLENDEIIVGLDRDSGFISTIKMKSTNETFRVELDYHAYNSVTGRSGAYIFKPAGNQSSPDCTDIEFMVIHGPVLTEAILIFHGISQHTTRVFHTSGPLAQAVQIENMLNLATADISESTELFMKLKTDIKNGDPPVFYSDSNGFQMHRRQKACGSGIETNFYPSTTCAYIEDDRYRFSVLTEQSHGVSSNREGQIEMMLDRRLHDDDGRGMGEGVLDTRKSIFSYFLLLEQLKAPTELPSKASLLAHTLIDFQTYPLNVFYLKPFYPVKSPPKYNAFLTQGIPCDIRIVNLRTYSHPNTENYPLNSALMTLHRRAFVEADSKALKYTCSLGPRHNCTSAFLKGTRLKHIEVAKLQHVSLTGLYDGEEIPCIEHFAIQSFELKSIRIDFK